MGKLYDKLQVPPQDRGLLTTMYLAFFTNGMMSILLGSLLPHIKAANSLDYTQSGLLLSAHQIGNLCVVILSGFLPYLIGRKYSTLLLGSGMCLGLLLMTLTGNPLLLLAAFALTGISRGCWSNICNTTVGEVSSRKTAALNILHAVFAVGALLSPLVVFAATRLTPFGWRGAPRFVCLLGAVVLVFIALSRLAGKPAPRPAGQRGGAAELLRTRSFWLTVGILFFYLGAESSIIGWFVTYFTEAGILSPAAAAFTPTLLWTMVMLGRMTCAALSTRMEKNRLILITALAFCAFFLIMLIAQNSVVSIVCLLGLGFSMAGIYPTTFSTLQSLSSTVANGMVIGIATGGAILMPALVGVVADRRGLSGGVSVILLSCVGMLLLILLKLTSDRKAAARQAQPVQSARQ